MSEPLSQDADGSPAGSAPGVSRPSRSRSEWTVHGERPVYESPWVEVSLADVEFGDGRRIDHHVVATRDAASCVVVNERDEVLLVWRHRFVIDRWVWEIPSGIIEDGEDPAAAAARETEEETGWRVASVEPLVVFHPVGGMLRAAYHVFRGRGAVRVGEPTEQDEAEKVAWIPLSEVPSLVDRGLVATSASLVGLLRVLAGG